jgi:tetratricopeptide (TPR) repeat protein
MALFYARRFTELQSFYSRPESAGARADLKIAAVAASETPAAALREAERMFPQEESRKSVVQAAGRFLMRIREYPKAADLLREGSSATSIPHSDFDLLSRTRPSSQIKLSSSGPVAAVQRYITALLDPQSKSGYASLLAPEWSSLTFNAQRNAMVTLLSPFSKVGGEALWTRAVGDIVISNVELVAEGSDAIGYRVRYADPSQGGARKTVAWVVKRGDAYQILGLRGDQATAGGEALALANKGDIAAARRWLDWERDEMPVVTSADPLAPEPFLKLWPLVPEISERDQVLAAAACLVARGRYYREGVETLSAVRMRALDHSFQSAIDFAWADGLRLNSEFAESLPLWGKVRQRYPTSEVAFTAMGTAMVRSGGLDEAMRLAHTMKPEDPLYASAQRTRARSLSVQHKYGEASRAYQAACESPKATAVDWNNRAWLTLFEPGTLKPDEDSANVGLRLTQGRGAPEIHTMSAILAETGQLKEARQMLIRYMALFYASEGINVSARYVLGRLAEQLGLADAATAIYTGIPRPKIDIGDDAYDLAQIRLKVMSPVK